MEKFRNFSALEFDLELKNEPEPSVKIIKVQPIIGIDITQSINIKFEPLATTIRSENRN
jgi:hypothetical protein